MEKKNSFPSQERLKNKKLIEDLFKNGKALKAYPIKMIFLKKHGEKESTFQVAFGVSRKKIHKAVQRNKLKRRMKEAFRLQKPVLIDKNKQFLAVMFIYTVDTILPYKDIEDAIKQLLQRFSDIK